MNCCYLSGPVVGYMTNLIREQIAAFRREDPAAPVTLVINSEGGDVYEGLAIYNLIKAAGIDVIVSGMAASIASVIAMAGRRVSMYANSILFVHHAMDFSGGNSAQLEQQLEQLRDADSALVAAYAEKSGRTEKEIVALLDGPNGAGSSITAERALELGLIDEVLDPAVAIAACAKRMNSHHHTTGVAQNSAATTTTEEVNMDPEKTTVDPAAECGPGKETAEEVVEVEKEVETKEIDDPAETRISELEKKVEELTAKLAERDAKLAAQSKFRAVTASAAQTSVESVLTFPELVKKHGFKKAAEQFPEVRKAYMQAQIRKGSIR